MLKPIYGSAPIRKIDLYIKIINYPIDRIDMDDIM